MRPEQLAVPGPVRLGVGGRVNTRVAAARPGEAFEGGLLGFVEHVARGEEEDHRAVPRQIAARELPGVLGCVDGEAAPRGELADCAQRDGNGRVAKPRRLGEDEDPRRLRPLCAPGAAR